MFVELDTRHDARYSVSLESDRDSGETQIVVADSGASSVLVFPVPGEWPARRFDIRSGTRAVTANHHGVAAGSFQPAAHADGPGPPFRTRRSTSICRPPAR
jgi:hypothetical protein